jgi:protein SCO1/2
MGLTSPLELALPRGRIDVRGLIGARLRVAVLRRRHGLAATALALVVIAAACGFGASFMARDARLGVVRFPISCGWMSQQDFTTATSLLHLFQFGEAEQVYAGIVRRDPDCAIAYWGVAMSRLGNPIYRLPGNADIAAARSALAAASAAAEATPRERAYIGALGAVFAVDDAPAWSERASAYAAAMGALVERYPEDAEAPIFYALALNFATLPDDHTHAFRTKAAELLLAAFAAQPDHPGIDHYLTYCLGHAAYQPKPFERIPMGTPLHRLLLAGIAVVAMSGAAVFVARTAGVAPGMAQGAPGGPFLLEAAGGTRVSDASLRGRWLLIYFGYASCPEICPTTLGAIAAALEKLGPIAAKIQPVFITIDPERDTPERADAFAKAFDPRILGLSGSAVEVAAVAKEYRVFFRKVPTADPSQYLMEHSSYVFLMDPQGRYVTLFTADDIEAPDDMVTRLRGLVSPVS